MLPYFQGVDTCRMPVCTAHISVLTVCRWWCWTVQVGLRLASGSPLLGPGCGSCACQSTLFSWSIVMETEGQVEGPTGVSLQPVFHWPDETHGPSNICGKSPALFPGNGTEERFYSGMGTKTPCDPGVTWVHPAAVMGKISSGNAPSC